MPCMKKLLLNVWNEDEQGMERLEGTDLKGKIIEWKEPGTGSEKGRKSPGEKKIGDMIEGD